MRGARSVKQLLEHSKRSFIAAIDTYNRIGSVCRVEGFAYYMTNAWELLLKARMIQITGDPKFIYSKRKRGERVETKTIDECVQYVFQNEIDPIRKNIEWISELRNQAVHYMITELESIYISYFQSSALNYTNCLNDWFGLNLNDEYDFPILSLFTLANDKVINIQILKGKYDKNIIDFVIDQQQEDRRIRSSNIDNTKAQMYVPLEYKAAIVKNPKDADMLFGKDNGGEAGLLFVETPKDYEKTHPYLHADIKKILTEKFDETVFPSKVFQTHDALCITYVNHFDSNKTYVHRQNKPVVWRYSELYLNFVIDRITKDKDYLFKMRKKYKQLSRKEKNKRN